MLLHCMNMCAQRILYLVELTTQFVRQRHLTALFFAYIRSTRYCRTRKYTVVDKLELTELLLSQNIRIKVTTLSNSVHKL